jgi:hypothetical protein
MLTSEFVYDPNRVRFDTDMSCHTDTSIPSPPPPTPADMIDMERLDAIQRNLKNGCDANDFTDRGNFAFDTCRSEFATPTHHGVSIS